MERKDNMYEDRTRYGFGKYRLAQVRNAWWVNAEDPSCCGLGRGNCADSSSFKVVNTGSMIGAHYPRCAETTKELCKEVLEASPGQLTVKSASEGDGWIPVATQSPQQHINRA